MKRIAALAPLFLAAVAAAEPSYEAEIRAWRAEHEKEIAAEDGWLTVVGLYWLEEGESRLGTAASNEIVLPEGSAPPLAGKITRRGRSFVLEEPGGAHPLVPDTAGGGFVELGRLGLRVIERGGRFGLRVRDRESPARRSFTGLSWFPVDPRLRVEARFVERAKPATLQVPNVLGDVVPMDSPGRAVFRLGGKRLALDAVLESPDSDRLFFIFSDGTTEKQTYPGGRFLYTGLPKGGRVTLDFNKAESPPCAFTAFATCPLPPRQNRLRVPIEAGERYTPAAPR